ncbi:hypothetical protein [Paenibacillus sp. EZ-K15]|uniref:hypothetical protein n=1 Tax=Paenibacillus sp. EZ-K15 TaxID=2044275 RepID=UPI000BFA8D81|nr:hypothetical protein [Paenibacillus sp. EZ-K15]
MRPMERDCTLFKIQNLGNTVTTKKIGLYEEFVCHEKLNSASFLHFSWVDPIKYRDKVIAKDKKMIFFLLFPAQGVICFFSNSESDLFFVTSKLNTEFMMDVKKINIFDSLEKSLKFNSDQFRLVALQVITLFGDIEKATTFSYEDTKKSEFSNILKEGRISHIEYYHKQAKINFSIDCQSSVSFYDTDTFDEIKNVLEGMVEYFEENTK